MSITKKIFWENPYLTQLQTRVASVNNNDITVEQTIFYALSGGQESDHGKIGDRSVLEARKSGAEIIYTLAEGHDLKVGEAVMIEIDWNRRYRLMRLHFAAELILELIYKELHGVQKIGAHIGQDKARIDFEWTENISNLFPSLQQKTAALVAADSEIISAFSDAEKERRYWEVAGVARVPCGGTHLRKTAEVGALTLKRKNIGKGKERIEIYID